MPSGNGQQKVELVGHLGLASRVLQDSKLQPVRGSVLLFVTF